MKVKKSVNATVDFNNLKMNYSYRLLEKNYNEGQAYGIEVERQDFIDGNVVNIERDAIQLISPDERKVEGLLELLYNNKVSPIHLVDIIGEYVDEYVSTFDVLEDKLN